MSILINNIETIAKKLQSVHDDQTSGINHKLMKGMARESALKESLRDIIPQKYEFGSGLIVDAVGNKSLQQDFILYDAFSSPTFMKFEKDVVLPVESVYACVEVKSRLNTRDLEDAIKNFESVQTLQAHFIQPGNFQVSGSNRIMGCVFAFTSDTQLNTLAKKLVSMSTDIPPEHRLACVCVLDKGNLVNVQKNDWRILHVLPSVQTTYVIKENVFDQNLYLFYLLLQTHLNHALNLPPDLWKYSQMSGDYIDPGIEIPIEAITDDSTVPLLKNLNVSGREYKRFSKMLKYIYKTQMEELSEKDIIDSGLSAPEFEIELKWAMEFYCSMLYIFFNQNK